MGLVLGLARDTALGATASGQEGGSEEGPAALEDLWVVTGRGRSLVEPLRVFLDIESGAWRHAGAAFDLELASTHRAVAPCSGSPSA